MAPTAAASGAPAAPASRDGYNDDDLMSFGSPRTSVSLSRREADEAAAENGADADVDRDEAATGQNETTELLAYYRRRCDEFQRERQRMLDRIAQIEVRSRGVVQAGSCSGGILVSLCFRTRAGVQGGDAPPQVGAAVQDQRGALSTYTLDTLGVLTRRLIKREIPPAVDGAAGVAHAGKRRAVRGQAAAHRPRGGEQHAAPARAAGPRQDPPSAGAHAAHHGAGDVRA